MEEIMGNYAKLCEQTPIQETITPVYSQEKRFVMTYPLPHGD